MIISLNLFCSADNPSFQTRQQAQRPSGHRKGHPALLVSAQDQTQSGQRMALNALKTKGDPRGQNTDLSSGASLRSCSQCGYEMLVMLCLLYTYMTLLVLELRQEDTLGGIHTAKPKLCANCNDDLNFSRVNLVFVQQSLPPFRAGT